jgi:hypothetical protein
MTSLIKKWAAVVGVVALGCSAVGAEGPWQPLAPLPEPNAGFACGRVDGKIVVMGGTNWASGWKNWLKTVHAFDLEKQEWSTLAPLAQPLAYPVVGDQGRRVLAVGGTTGEAPFTGAILAEKPPVIVQLDNGVATPSVLCAGGMVGDRLIFVGGTDSATNLDGFRRDAFAWDVHTGAQHPLPPYPGPAFGIGTGVAADDELLVFGGCRFDASSGQVVNLVEARAFSVRRNEWRALRPMPHAVRGLAAVRLDERHFYLGGGCRNDPEGFTDAAFVYDLVEDSYTPAPPLPYRAALVGLIRDGEYVYCIAGEPAGQQRTDALYRISRSELLVEVRPDR